MIAKIKGASFDGLMPIDVGVEVCAVKGLPKFEIVGMGQTSVKEGSQRIRAALECTGIKLKNKKITVNLAPAGIKKNGAHLDLPIALGILSVCGIIDKEKLHQSLCFGELSLDGSIQAVQGGFALVEQLHKPYKNIIYPAVNIDVAACFDEKNLLSVSHLSQLIEHFVHQVPIENPTHKPLIGPTDQYMDFAQIQGQHKAKRMLEIAASGGHHVMLSGPPGIGKTLLAKAFPGILPPLARKDQREVQKIYSACGFPHFSQKQPPIRAPHHHASKAGMVGGGQRFQVGEMTLAHQGVLFMDEFPEFQRDIIEALREPMEEGVVRIRRATGMHCYPAKFQLIASMNLCPCGNTGDPHASCVCTAYSVMKYQKKISRPIADRIDLWSILPKMSWGKVWNPEQSQTSQEIQQRVVRARKVQVQRWKQSNAGVGLSALKNQGQIENPALHFIEKMVDEKNFSVRSMVKSLRVARTIADLEESKAVSLSHVMEALQYRFQEVQ